MNISHEMYGYITHDKADIWQNDGTNFEETFLPAREVIVYFILSYFLFMGT